MGLEASCPEALEIVHIIELSDIFPAPELGAWFARKAQIKAKSRLRVC
jgi:hypothetical protein